MFNMMECLEYVRWFDVVRRSFEHSTCPKCLQIVDIIEMTLVFQIRETSAECSNAAVANDRRYL